MMQHATREIKPASGTVRKQRRRTSGKSQPLSGFASGLNKIPLPTRSAFLFVLGALAVSKVIPGGANVIFIGCAIYALLGPRQALQSLAVMLVVLMASSAWVSSSIKDLRWLVIGCAFVGVVVNAISNARPVTSQAKMVISTVIGFSVCNVLIAFSESLIPSISIFKLISFAVGAVTIVAGFQLAQKTRFYWENWFSGWFLGVLLAGPLCLLWGGGFMKNSEGFEGAFDHPQTQGVIMGIAASFFCGRYLLYSKGGSIHFALGIASLAAVYLSQSRTGGFAFMLAGGATLLVTAVLGGDRLKTARLARIMPLALLAAAIVGFTAPAQFSGIMGEYVSKGDDEVGGVIEAFGNSRESLIEISMENFNRHPILGIGFGVPSTAFTELKEFWGIPLSASTEKGFLPTALLEETGVVGTALALGLLIAIVVAQIQNWNVALLWAMSAALLMNLGEAMFFSMGGLGLFVWMVIGWSLVPVGRPEAKLSVRRKLRSHHPDQVPDLLLDIEKEPTA